MTYADSLCRCASQKNKGALLLSPPARKSGLATLLLSHVALLQPHGGSTKGHSGVERHLSCRLVLMHRPLAGRQPTAFANNNTTAVEPPPQAAYTGHQQSQGKTGRKPASFARYYFPISHRIRDMRNMTLPAVVRLV